MKYLSNLATSIALLAVPLFVTSCQDSALPDDPEESSLVVEDMRCEYLTDPVGIDETQPRFSWKLSDPEKVRAQKQTAWQVVVTGDPIQDDDEPVVLWDSGKVVSGESLNNAYAGRALESNRSARWKVRVWDKDGKVSAWSREATFSMGLLEPSDWKGEWIRHAGVDQTKHIWYRKNFQLDGVPRRAVVHLASVGYHELYVNGKRVDQRVLAPGVSNLEKRVFYVTYPIEKFLSEGRNVIAVWVGSGWARADGSYGKGVWQQPAGFKCQVNMSHGVNLHSDASWRCRVSHEEYLGKWKGGGRGEYGGEQVDARAALPEWNRADYDDSAWSQATVFEKAAELSAQMFEPTRKVKALRPVSVTKGNQSVTFDMGRNFTGWIEFKLRNGSEGQVVRFTTANQEGKIIEYDQESRYIHDADGEGVFSHRFNYQAGRWITVHGLGYQPELDDLTGYVITNDRQRHGRFECSKPLFNKIYEIDLRTYLANTVNGVTMDCPHRERYGYGEIALACSWGCAIPHYDSAAYYRKVAQDWFDVQREDGFINTIAPQVYRGAGGTLWSSAPVTMGWEFYKAYGDKRELEKAYQPMKKWIDFLGRSISDDGVLVPYASASRFLGDWATPHGSEYGNTPAAQLFNNCVYAYNLMVITKVARILGNIADEKIYQQQLKDLRHHAHQHFFNPDSKNYIDGRQLSMAFPLYVGITPESERAAVFDGFVKEITERKPYLDTGSSGLPMLLKYLVEDAERADLLFDCLNRTERPGYGYFLSQGATTWPEYWNMDHDSQIHTCYTGISGVFTKAIGGIRPDPEAWGMKQCIIKPQLVGDLTWANTTSGTYYGEIVSNWKRDGSVATFKIELPVNTTAKVFIPASTVEDVKESGRPTTDAAGVTYLGKNGVYQVFRVESGSYEFTSMSAPAVK